MFRLFQGELKTSQDISQLKTFLLKGFSFLSLQSVLVSECSAFSFRFSLAKEVHAL